MEGLRIPGNLRTSKEELTIWKADHFQLAVRSYDITTFDNFLTNLKKNQLYINQQIVSLKLIDGEFTSRFLNLENILLKSLG